MGAGMARGRTPRKPRAAAVAPADLGLDPEAAGAREKLDEQKVPVPREAPKPDAADVALTDTDPEYLVQKDASTITPVVDVLKIPRVEEAPGEAPKPGAADVALTDTDPETTGVDNLTGSKRDEKYSSTTMLMAEVLKKPRVEVPGEALNTDEVMGAANLARGKRDEKDSSTSAPMVEVLKTPQVEIPREAAKTNESTLLSAAKVEASKSLAKIEQLHQSAMELKSLGVKPIKLTKAAKLASDALDKRVLSEHIKAIEEAKKEGDCCDLISPPPLLQFRINAPKNIILSHLSGRRQLIRPGIDLVSWKGSFAVPRSLMSGNPQIDEMNLVLFDVYMSVHDLLDEAQMATTFAKLGLQVPRSKAQEDDFRAAVRELRTTAHVIQVTIVSVGGLPLREPALYWREAFPDVTF